MGHGRFLMAGGLLLVAGLSAANDRLLLERLRTDHAAMAAAERDFHQRRGAGDLDGTEAADYAGYIAYLHRVVAEGCVAVDAAGLSPPPEVDCLTSSSLPAPAVIDQASERTPAEQIAVLDAELRGGLGEFDEMLLREQERVRAAAPMREPGGGGSGDSGASAGSAGADGAEGAEGAEGTEGARGTEGREGGTAAQGPAGDGAAGQGQGDGTRSPRGRSGAPPDIPDGSDDDVVARQLREAAEKERDPELKKRLWEEYRRYKEGTR